METSGSAYPADFTFDAPERVANWRPLVHWLLAIPHMIVLAVLGVVAEVIAVVSWFVILFTGRLPEGLAGLQCLYLRYTTRTYTYMGFLHEQYPPFTFDTTPVDPGDGGPLRVDFRPALEGRNRVTVFFRIILAIPHLVVLAILGIAAYLCVVVAFFAVLFTGRWPDGLRTFVLGVLRWSLRMQAYLFMLTDEYPPFTLD